MSLRHSNGMPNSARSSTLLMVFCIFQAFVSTLAYVDYFESSVTQYGFVMPDRLRVLASKKGDVCQPVDTCEMCTVGDVETIPVCSLTGRRQRFECKTFDTDGDETDEKRAEIRSCKKTEADEEFAMVR